MVNVILTHEVKEFSTWKAAFEAGEPLRAQAGVTIEAVYTAVDNPNKVTVITAFPSVESVSGFMANPNLRADMESAGVVGAPSIQVLNKM